MPKKKSTKRRTHHAKKSPSKKGLVTETRREYAKLRRAYHAIGKKALGKPKGSAVKKDYLHVKREMNKVGARLGRLTGSHKGR